MQKISIYLEIYLCDSAQALHKDLWNKLERIKAVILK